VRLDDSKGLGTSPRDSPGLAEALDVIRASRNSTRPPAAAEAAAAGREDDMAAVGDVCCSYDGSMGPSMLLERPPLATAAVTADASFPSVLFTDVFCEGLAKQVKTWATATPDCSNRCRT
jgi:hypothetical protein